MTENPNFQSTVGSSVDFLKYDENTPTLIETGAIPISGITTDFSGTTRDVSTPDIGAWELNGIFGAPPSITYTPISNTACLGTFSLEATITDLDGINVAPGTKPRMYFKKTTDANDFVGNTSSDNGWKFVEATNSSSPFEFEIDDALLQSPITGGDEIQYFVVAQDLASVISVTINSGAFANTPASVALTSAAFPIGGSINSFLALATIPTSVTIGATGTYPDLTGPTGLFAAINANSLSGNTEAVIIDAAITEPGTVALNQITYGCSGAATLTIRPQTASTLSGSFSGGLIRLIGADNVVIDGSNSGGTDRSLTIINTLNSTATAVIWIGSASASDGATDITVKNCNIQGLTGTSTVGGIVASSGATLGAVALASNSNLIVQNNAFTRVQNGVYFHGNAAGATGLTITQNDFGSTVATDKLGFRGIGLLNANGYSINNNNIVGVITASVSTSSGIMVAGNSTNGEIFNNQIRDIKNTSTAGYGTNGIVMQSNSSAANTIIYNNFISDVAAFGFNAVGINDNGYGVVFAPGGAGYNFYHNTIDMNTNQTTGMSAGVLISSSGQFTGMAANSITFSSSTPPSNIDIRNNIIVNSQTGSYSRYAVYSSGTSTNFSNINNNNYVSNGDIGFLTSNRVTLANWQTATGQDANSVNIAPVFVSSTDLHLVPASNLALNDLGTPIAAVTTDIDGEARSLTAPDMGADEFTAFDCDAGIIDATGAFCAGVNDVQVTLKNFGLVTLT